MSSRQLETPITNNHDSLTSKERLVVVAWVVLVRSSRNNDDKNRSNGRFNNDHNDKSSALTLPLRVGIEA